MVNRVASAEAYAVLTQGLAFKSIDTLNTFPLLC